MTSLTAERPAADAGANATTTDRPRHPRPAIYAAPRNDGGNLLWATPPQQPTIAAERLHRKQRLAASFRLFGRLGYDYGGAGHITARDPEFPDHFWVNPAGVYFGHVRVSDLLLVNHHGQIVEGDGLLNRAAFAIHSELHKARPDVVAAAHSHALWGKAFAARGRLLEPISQDATAFYDDQVLFDDYTGVVLDSSEGERIARALGGKKAAILRNHGLLTVGTTVESAVWWYIAAENAAQAQLIAEAAGPLRPLDDAVARHTHGQVGTEPGGWFSFQSLWDRVVRDEPDFLD